MSKLLIDEPPLQVLPSLAVAIGLNEALFLQQLHYWLTETAKYKPHYRDFNGLVMPWIYNTYHAKDDQKETGWQANFPFWSIRTIKRIVTRLKNKGLIITTNKFNDSSTNRTLWYTIDYKVLNSLPTSGTLDSDKVALSREGQVGTLMTETTTETTTDISPSAENNPHGQSAGDIEQGAASLFVSALDAKARPVLYHLEKAGVIEMVRLDSESTFRLRWVDGGELVERIPLKLAKAYGYKVEPQPDETIPPGEVDAVLREAGYDPDEVGAQMKSAAEQALAKVKISGGPENDYVPDSCTCAALAASGAMPPCSYCENLPLETGSALEDDLTEAFGPNPRQRHQAPQPKPYGKADLSEVDQAHLRTFGHLPGDKAPQAFDTIQEIRQSGWEVWDSAVEIGIAYCLKAIRTKKPNFAVPNNARKDWHKSVAGHLQDYLLDDLGTLYELAVDKLEKANMSYTRPGSLTKTLPDVVNEPTQKTIIDDDGGFYV